MNNPNYVMVIDLDKCIGCYACQVSCQMEHKLPEDHARIKLTIEDSGPYPENKRLFLPLLCNHCTRPLCLPACKQNVYANKAGIIIHNTDACLGCGQCISACKHQAIFLNPKTKKIDKCDFCYSRINHNLMPVCVLSCMARAMEFGDISSSHSSVWKNLEKNSPYIYVSASPKSGDKEKPHVLYILRKENRCQGLKKIDLDQYKPDSHHIIKPLAKVPHQEKTLTPTVDTMCPSECGILVEVNNGKAEKIYGNPGSVNNNGTLCAKGAAGLQLVYSPYRIKTPLIRTGERGDNTWKAMSWDAILKIIAKRLMQIKKTNGAESVIFDSGDVTNAEPYYRLFYAWGTPNIFSHSGICDTNRRWGHKLIMGDERPLPDLQRPLMVRSPDGGHKWDNTYKTKLLINIGANPLVATRFNFMSRGIPGAKLTNQCMYVVIDPSFTNSASHADLWLPIVPGNDHALLAAMLHFILTNDQPGNPDKSYLDHTLIDTYTSGWQEFKRLFLEQSLKKDPSNQLPYFSLPWAEEKTGIPVEKLKYLSHLLGITKPAAIEIGMHGTAHHTNGDITSILMTVLCVITGNVDTPGGVVFVGSSKPGKNNEMPGSHFLEEEVMRYFNSRKLTGSLKELHKDLYGSFPLAWKGVVTTIPQNITNDITLHHGNFQGYSYPVKALFVRTGNPVITAGNTDNWIKALTMKTGKDYKLDLMVVIDTHINETGNYADIILTECSYLERMGIGEQYTINPEILLRERVIKPLYQSKSPFSIAKLLTKHLSEEGDKDINEKNPFKTFKKEEDFIDQLLKTSPSLYNIGQPLPYPDYPEGSLIIGVPDNPFVYLNGKCISKGKLITVKWLRENKGKALYPASYYRYKTSQGAASGIYPNTISKKFEFHFKEIARLNKKYQLNYPESFYWQEPAENPKNGKGKEMHKEYPFQLVTGRTHHSMTMTQVCPYLSLLETETQRKIDSAAIPVFLLHQKDGKSCHIKTGDLITLENPDGKRIKGKALISESIKPGVIKTTFGSGGRNAPGMGLSQQIADDTPNSNKLVSPAAVTSTTGMPGFGDIMVKIVEIQSI